MAIPFLPASLISPTYSYLEIPTVEDHTEMMKVEKLQKYYKKNWISKITPEELSINGLNISTNNAAESYHSKLKSIIRTCRPRIWTFMTALNNVIDDTDNDIGRLISGRDISRRRKKAYKNSDEQRKTCREKLRNGDIDPWEFIKAISHTIGHMQHQDTFASSESEDEDEIVDTVITGNSCVVCLLPLLTTWIFMPCRHANCCGDCSERICQFGQTCPVCRSIIEERFQIFTC